MFKTKDSISHEGGMIWSLCLYQVKIKLCYNEAIVVL